MLAFLSIFLLCFSGEVIKILQPINGKNYEKSCFEHFGIVVISNNPFF